MSEWIEHDGSKGFPLGLRSDAFVEWENAKGVHGQTYADNLIWDGGSPSSRVVRYRFLGVRPDTAGSPTHDPVNNPSHYMLFPEQGIEFIDVRDVLIERLKNFTPKQIDYWSRSFEYLARAGGKNGVEDIKKAKWYLDRLVKTLEETE